ncbi:MAG TPA: META domain-containing protein [Anaerolineae bacterium]|nr:META domain-containing protein [Anaerolineae bacterium]
MDRPKLLIALLVLALFIAACGQEEPTATPVPPTETPTEAPTEAVVEAEPTATPTEIPPTEVPPTPTPASPLNDMAHVADPLLIDKTWQWQRRDDASGNTIITVPDPSSYTIVFNEDGTFKAVLDCNSASGGYATPSSGSIFMELGAMTAAACEPGSLADQMANMFGPAQDYRFEEDDAVLVFSWVAGGPIDYYRDAAAESAAAEADLEVISPDSIQMDLNGLATSFEWQVQPASPPSPGPGGGGFPPHILLTFDDESPEDVLANQGRRMYIFPTQAYISLYESQGNSIVFDQVTRLAQLIAEAESRPELPDSPIPLLPPPSSFMDRWVQFRDQEFGVGQGVRYVSDSPFRQQIGPWTNETTDYYYQGLTAGGGAFYVSLIWPVSTESLPDTAEDVPDDVMAAASNPETSPAYQQQVKDTLNALPPSAWAPDLALLDAMVQSLTFPTEAAPSLTGTTWQWVSMTTPIGETIAPPDPANYTILFDEPVNGPGEGQSAGTVNIEADCNQVGATYVAEGDSIDITLGPTTLAACGGDSLDQQFLSSLEAAAIYFFEEGDLFLDLMVDSGTMRFSAESETDAPGDASPGDEPETPPDSGTGTATGVITAPDGVFIRSGPGTEYPATGTIAFDETVTITGRNQERTWWQIEVPTVPVSEGWIAADFVDVTGGEDVPVVEAPPQEAALVGATWQWLSTVTPVEETTVGDPSRYTIVFDAVVDDQGQATIQADCNTVGATYTVEDNSIDITLGPSTLAACPEGSLDQQFLGELENAAIYFFEGDDLFMDMIADGGTMRFTSAEGGGAAPAPAPDPELPASSAQGILFQLVSFGPEGAEQTVLPGTEITAVFDETQVSGSAGCNDYTAPLTPVDDYFTIGPIAVTSKACSEPAGIMEQEQAYLTALEATDGFLWLSQPVDGGSVITAGRLFYTPTDGASGVINYVAR